MKKIRKILVFIATIILVFSTVSIAKTDAKNVNYMRLVDKKHQRYEYNDGITVVNPRFNKKKNETYWVIYLNGIGDSFEKQNSKGYFTDDAGVEGDAPALKFPVKKNLTWKAGIEQRKIISTKTKVKTKYKTFKNAVKVQVGKASEKHYQYFVPNYGMVKATMKGSVYRELVKVTY